MPHVVGPPAIPPPPLVDPPLAPQTTWDASQDVPFPADTAAELVAPDAEAFPYDLWICWGEVLYRSGWTAMPQAGDDSQGPLPSRLVKLAAAWSKVRIHYRAVRKGLPPVLPHPVSLDGNLTLVSCRDRAAVVLADDGGSWIWTTRGRRLYACTLPVFAVPSGLLVPTPPYSTAIRGSLNIPPQQFSQQIV